MPCIVQSTKYNAGYLSVKQSRMEHMLSDDESEGEELEGQFCFWNHEGEPSSAGIPLDPGAPWGDDTPELAAVKGAGGGGNRGGNGASKRSSKKP